MGQAQPHHSVNDFKATCIPAGGGSSLRDILACLGSCPSVGCVSRTLCRPVGLDSSPCAAAWPSSAGVNAVTFSYTFSDVHTAPLLYTRSLGRVVCDAAACALWDQELGSRDQGVLLRACE